MNNITTEQSEAFRKAHLRFRRWALLGYLSVIGMMYFCLLHFSKGKFYDRISAILFYSFWIVTLGFVGLCAIVLQWQKKKYGPDAEKTEPNQAPEPTPTAVTPRAGHESRQP